jgi:D-galactarolactone cycloisomerase
VQYIPHGWNTALGLAVDLHLASALPRTELVEYLTGSPFIDDLVDTPWTLDAEGMLRVPDGAGLGISLNFDAIERHTGSRFDDGSRIA